VSDPLPPHEAEPPGRRRLSWARPTAVKALLIIVALLLAEVGISVVRSPGGGGIGTQRPGGSAGSYRFDYEDPLTGEPVRFNPCEPIRYVINEKSAPPWAVEDLHGAVERIADVSGLTFRYAGVTDEPVSFVRSAYQPERYGERWAPILVGWTDLSDVSEDSVAIAESVFLTNDDLIPVRVTGAVIIDTEDFLASGFGYGITTGEVFLHELSHVLGLTHVPDPTQLMHQEVTLGPAVLGRGDRGGLASLGRRRGCVRTPGLPSSDAAAAAAGARTFRLRRIEGRVRRFDHCLPLYYRISWVGSPPDAIPDVHRAFAELGRATGFHVVFIGLYRDPLTWDPREVRDPVEEGTVIDVAWTPRNFGERWPERFGHARAVLDRRTETLAGGFLVFNEDVRLPGGFGPGRTWGDVLLHQLGHLVGLDDVSDRREAMHPGLSGGPARWGPGDREGLRRLGRAAGCVD
jgi:hypothetical protein